MCPLRDIHAFNSSMQRTEGWKCTKWFFWNSSHLGFQMWTLLLLSHSIPLLSILSSGYAVRYDNEIEISKDYYTSFVGQKDDWVLCMAATICIRNEIHFRFIQRSMCDVHVWMQCQCVFIQLRGWPTIVHLHHLVMQYICVNFLLCFWSGFNSKYWSWRQEIYFRLD